MINSPCKNICTIDPKSELCIGCGRSRDEIANWLILTDKQKKDLLNRLKSKNKIFTIFNNMLNKRIMNSLYNISKKQIFLIGLILILALARLIPHPWNFTPIVAVAILSGYFFKNIYASFAIVIISMLIGDLFLGFYENMIFVYLSLILISFIFYKISKKINFKNLFIYGFVGSVIFFVISNFGVWALGSLGVNNIPYEKNLNGLIECFVVALPFFHNTFLSTLIFSYSAIYIYKSLPAWSSSR